MQLNRSIVILYTSASIAAFSAVAYELLLASYATFLLGATIFQYSLVISLMMMSMGIGALLAQKSRHRPILWFVLIELALAWIAGLAVPSLYFIFATQAGTRIALLFFVIAIGLAIGMEIPLLNEIQDSKMGVSRILFFDYLGGFAGGIAFPIFLLPHLGFFRVAALLSVLNALVAALFFFHFRTKLKRNAIYLFPILLTFLCATSYLYFAEEIRRHMEFSLFGIHQNIS